jgi:hypothetical protein
MKVIVDCRIKSGNDNGGSSSKIRVLFFGGRGGAFCFAAVLPNRERDR